MPKIEIFFDSSALIAGIVSSHGAARALLLLGEDDKIILIVTEQVITEVEHNIARKAPKALPFARQVILSSKIQVLRDPPVTTILEHQDWIDHKTDLPILIAASTAHVDYLATLDSRHFINNPEVARLSGLRIGSPGDVLAWVRDHLAQ
jgi:predicted nucleic acid-binding protein